MQQLIQRALKEQSKSNLVKESSIDFPQQDLASDVWDKVDSGYVLKADVKSQIQKYLDGILDGSLMKLVADIHVVGSICSNLYTDSSDIDVHVVPVKMSEEKAQSLKDLVKNYVSKNPFKSNNHPIEVYVQTEPEQDLFSVGDYDFKADTWIKEPTIFSFSYDPYDIYADIMDTVQEIAKSADINLGELKRDVIDYETITNAMGKLPAEVRKDLQSKLKGKLAEINKDVEALLKDKKIVVDLRRAVKAKDALKDEDKAKKWSDNNAVFKFMNRYQYLKVISDLEKIYDEDNKKKIEPTDVPKVKKAVAHESRFKVNKQK